MVRLRLCSFDRMVPEAALNAYTSKILAVENMKKLGGIHAPLTAETKKLMSTIQRVNRLIKKNGWYSKEAV